MDSEQERLLKEIIRSVIAFGRAGNVGAQIRLCIECMVGANVPKDLVKAEEWLKKGVQELIGVQDLEGFTVFVSLRCLRSLISSIK